MRRLVAILFGMALTFSSIPYAAPDSYKGYAHVCTGTNALCPSETPLITIVCPTGMVCAGKTSTTTSTTTATGTGTFYQTAAQPVTATVTASGGTLYGANGVRFITATSTSTATASATVSGTGTSTGTGTLPSSQTLTFTGSQSNTGTAVAVNPVYSWTQTSTTTVGHIVTATSLTTLTLTNTVTVTGTATLTRSGTISGTASVTLTATVTGTSGATATATVTGTQTTTAVATTTQTATVSASSTFTQSQTFTASQTTITVETVTGTGTAVLGGGDYTATGTVTNTGAVTATGSFTGVATATATFTGSASGTATGTVTDTSSATATSATLPTTITYVPPVTNVPGGDLFLVEGIWNYGNSAAFVTAPKTSIGDFTAAPTVGSSSKFDQDCDLGPGGTGLRCMLVHGSSTVNTWIPEGNISITLWASTTSAASIELFFNTCTGGSPTGGIYVPATIHIAVTSSSMQQFTAVSPMPSGVLLPPNYQLCLMMSASTTSGTPTVTLGGGYPYNMRVNGPWTMSNSGAFQ